MRSHQCLQVGSFPDLAEVFFVDPMFMDSFGSVDFFFPAFHHLCKTDNIEALQCMSAMWWVLVNFNIVNSKRLTVL